MAFLRLTIPPWLVQLGITLAVLLGAFIAGRVLNRLLLDWLEQFSKRQEMPGQRIYTNGSDAPRATSSLANRARMGSTVHSTRPPVPEWG